MGNGTVSYCKRNFLANRILSCRNGLQQHRQETLTCDNCINITTILFSSCAIDKTLKYDFKESGVQRFSIASFRFLPDYKNVYFHCKVTACPKGNSNSRCAVGCKDGKSNSRRRREAPTRDIEFNLAVGPVSLNRQQKAIGKMSGVLLSSSPSLISEIINMYHITCNLVLPIRLLLKNNYHRTFKWESFQCKTDIMSNWLWNLHTRS